MKTLNLYAAVLFSIFTFFSANAQTTINKDSIKVWGNCGTCKKTIEKAARSAGVSYANWNEDSKQLIVRYSAAKTSNAKIQQAVAAAGYDTQDFTGSDAAYEKLAPCCQYDRKSTTGITPPKITDDATASTMNASTTEEHKGMDCCKDKAGKMKSCDMDHKGGAKMDCCKDKDCCKDMAGKMKSCSMDHKAGKMDCCKDKDCCKDMAGKMKSCSMDHKAGATMACCKEKDCCEAMTGSKKKCDMEKCMDNKKCCDDVKCKKA